MKITKIFNNIILEARRESVIKRVVDKIGVPEDIAEFSFDIGGDGKAEWVAKQLKGKSMDYAQSIKSDLENIMSIFKYHNFPDTNIKQYNLEQAVDLYNKFKYIKDWLDHPDTGYVNIRHMTWDEAERRAREWHESLDGGEIADGILEKDDKIIHTFQDKFQWVLRPKSFCKKSSESAGHCGQASEDDMYILSLIRGNEEFITVDWHPKKGYVIQLKGKNNKKPAERYHKHILWLLTEWGGIKKLRTNEGYRSETNFQVLDLNDDNFNFLIRKRPDLISGVHIIEKYGIDKGIELYGEEKLFRTLGWDYIESLLEKSLNDELAKIIIKAKGNTLDSDFIYNLLGYSKNHDELARMIIDIKGNTLDSESIRSLLYYSENPDELAKMIIDIKSNTLNSDDIFYLLHRSKNHDELSRMIIDVKGNALDLKDIDNLLHRSKNHDELSRMIIDVKDNTFNLKDIDNLFRDSSIRDELTKIIIKVNGNTLDSNDIHSLLYHSKNRDEIKRLMLKNGISKDKINRANDLL
jgi:hypothetical protein